MKFLIPLSAVMALVAAPTLAQQSDLSTASPDVIFQIAVDSGICEDRDVRTAEYNLNTDVIEVTCEEEAVALVPLVGGLGGGGIAAIAGGLALALGLGSTSGT